MRRLIVLSVLSIALLAAGVATAESDLWLHVRVEQDGDSKVSINLPFSLVSKTLPMIETSGHFHDRSIHLNGHRLSYVEVRDLWLEVREGPDMTFVTVEEDDETVRVWKEDGYLFVRVRDRRDEQADVRMPLAVVDALLRVEGELDFEAAMAALVAEGPGELITVQEDDESVRVWLDRVPEAAP